MAIDTDAKKFSLMTLGDFDAALPATGTLTQADLQHMLWGYIDPLWADVASTELACVAFSEGTVAAIVFSQGSVAAITFAEGDVAAITFEGGSCP